MTCPGSWAWMTLCRTFLEPMRHQQNSEEGITSGSGLANWPWSRTAKKPFTELPVLSHISR